MKPGSLLKSKVPNPASKSKDEERPISNAQSFRLGVFSALKYERKYEKWQSDCLPLSR